MPSSGQSQQHHARCEGAPITVQHTPANSVSLSSRRPPVPVDYSVGPTDCLTPAPQVPQRLGRRPASLRPLPSLAAADARTSSGGLAGIGSGIRPRGGSAPTPYFVGERVERRGSDTGLSGRYGYVSALSSLGRGIRRLSLLSNPSFRHRSHPHPHHSTPQHQHTGGTPAPSTGGRTPRPRPQTTSILQHHPLSPQYQNQLLG